MKTLIRPILFTVILVFALSTSAWAGFQGPGAAVPANSVKTILDKPVDDMYVTLTGNIVKQLHHDRYIFRDSTGEIIVEIDEERFPYEVQITPQTLVRITGEVDTEFMKKPEIDVKTVEVVQKSASKGGFKEK